MKQIVLVLKFQNYIKNGKRRNSIGMHNSKYENRICQPRKIIET